MPDQAPHAARKPRLGKGLSGLIVNSHAPDALSGAYTTVPADQSSSHQSVTPSPIVSDLPTASILANPYQPRKDFSETDLKQLAESISQQGLLQPLLVTPSSDPDDDTYILIAGERRLRAAKLAGLENVPCTIRQATRADMLELALVENLQREDLNPIERAAGYREFMSRLSLTQTEAAQRLAQPRTTLANHLRLLDLCDELQQMLAEGMLTFGHGKALAGLVGQPSPQLAIARKTVAEGLSVRQVEKLVGQVRSRQTGARASTATARPAHRPPYVIDLEERLTQAIGTRARILPGRTKHSGRIVLDYYSLDDFDRITSRLGIE